ncbi:MAG: DUF6379 domain-containing protein [Pseudomonadota bacterium]
MYDKHIICEQGFANVVEDGKTIGFKVGIRLPYYRSQPLSIVEDIAVTVDQHKYERGAIRFGVRGQRWSLDEMETQTAERWEFGEVAELLVLAEGGLAPGAHELEVAEQLRISYLPWAPVTTCKKTLELGA